MEPVRVGIIGLGRSGWDIHAKALHGRSDFRVAAVADVDPARRDEADARFECRAYGDYRELLADAEVELVVNATQSYMHAPVSIEALRAGKHVLVEKPFALSTAEADAMIAAARETGRVLTAFQCRRLDPDFLKIQEVIQSGVLGEVHLARLAHYGFARRRDWQTLRKFGGGQLNNWGPHVIDQALLLLGGEWTDLFAQLARVASAGDAEDHVKLALRNRRGMVAEVELAICAYPQANFVVMGAYGSLTGTTRELKWKYYDPAAVPPITADEGSPADRAYGTGETLPWVEESFEVPSGGPSTAALYYDRLFATLREGAPLFVTPESVRTQIDVLEAARRSEER
jgi:scyllo-inositol 2-dehydrogenase (NADP+)